MRSLVGYAYQMSRIPWSTLPAFRLVAELQNLRAAADRLHLTHSAVSQQIRLLEEQIGIPLFDRIGRKVALNAAGRALQAAVAEGLARIEEGVRAAEAVASGRAQQIRLTLLPSFAQRWLLPRIGRWRERHPAVAIELHTSFEIVDLQRDGFHAALRQGSGPWRGLEAEPLLDSPLILVGSPDAARRLQGQPPEAIAREPLLGPAEYWEPWFALAGIAARPVPVAAFNDAGMMLQAAEQNIGISLSRELLAADALRDGRLVRLSPVTLPFDRSDSYWLAYPPALRDWPPLVALRGWLREEIERSRAELQAAGR